MARAIFFRIFFVLVLSAVALPQLKSQTASLQQSQTGGCRLEAVDPKTATAEITAADYCEFLNAIAATDPQNLYDEKMESDLTSACATRAGEPGNFSYQVIAGKESAPISFVSSFDEVQYCSWKNNSASTSTFNFNSKIEPSILADLQLKSNQMIFNIISGSIMDGPAQKSMETPVPESLFYRLFLDASLMAVAIEALQEGSGEAVGDADVVELSAIHEEMPTINEHEVELPSMDEIEVLLTMERLLRTVVASERRTMAAPNEVALKELEEASHNSISGLTASMEVLDLKKQKEKARKKAAAQRRKERKKTASLSSAVEANESDDSSEEGDKNFQDEKKSVMLPVTEFEIGLLENQARETAIHADAVWGKINAALDRGLSPIWDGVIEKGEEAMMVYTRVVDACRQKVGSTATAKSQFMWNVRFENAQELQSLWTYKAAKWKASKLTIDVNNFKERECNLAAETKESYAANVAQTASQALEAWSTVVTFCHKQHSEGPVRLKSWWENHLKAARNNQMSMAASAARWSVRRVQLIAESAMDNAKTSSSIAADEQAMQYISQVATAHDNAIETMKQGHAQSPTEERGWWRNELKLAQEAKERWMARVRRWKK